jgi:hypothetical protein
MPLDLEEIPGVHTGGEFLHRQAQAENILILP